MTLSTMNGFMGSIILAPLHVMAYAKRGGRLRCHKRPKSREETPKEGSDSGLGWGRYRITLPKTIAISCAIERRETSSI
jgi:hypothetical protein